MLWQGGDSFIEDSFPIEGKYCSSFQPDVTILDGKAYQKFNKSLMFDFGVQLQFSSDSPSVTQVAHAKQSDSDPQKACYCCRKNVKLSNMRTHVGKHILAKDIESRFPCGYCGRDACSRSIIHTDKKKRYPKPQSNCPYYVHMTRTPSKSSRRIPCTNVIITCPYCKAAVWKYNIVNHYADMHPDIETVDQVDEEEHTRML